MVLTYAELASRILGLSPSAGSTIVVAIDGCGGSGKTTFAGRLGSALSCQVVHTDDFAAWDNPLNWWPRLREQVLEPLARGEEGRYQRYDWVEQKLAEWHTVTGSVVILEGVSASRVEFRPYLAYRIWVECSADIRLQRGLERDGPHMKDQWLTWMSEEDSYVERDQPLNVADLVVHGAPSTQHSEHEFEAS